MSNFLIVPIHLDALWLKTDQSVAEGRVDFTRLPFFDGQRDVNPNITYLSEDIVAKPFQPLNLRLKPGVHLHWSLPDALTQGTHTTEGTTFPAVPNRWLVTRSRQNGASPSTVEKQWVVESDYLYPDGQGYHAGSVTFPLEARPDQGKYHPFRYLGRQMSLDLWLDPQKDGDTPPEYLGHITAVGYGEPTFAAFYPNCHSVFGFYDNDTPGADVAGLQYDVIGWYTQPEQDYFSQLMARLQAAGDDLIAGLEREARWTVAGLETTVPSQMLCYSRLQFNPSAKDIDPTTAIAIGHTGTEALSAYLAQKIAPERKHELEDQLEAVLLLSRLEGQQLDLDPKFLEARHEKGFSAVSAASRWTVKPESAQNAPADVEKALTEARLTLPQEIAEALNDLNLIQQELDQTTQDIDTIRHQIFADWYKYMLCVYPPEDRLDHYPEVNEVKNYIELKEMPLLEEKLLAARNIEQRRGTMIAALQAQLTTYNQQHPGQSVYTLKQMAGPRYWQPTEPVVLIAGDLAQPTVRHGQDGRSRADNLLECGLLTEVITPGGDKDQVKALWAKFDAIWREQANTLPEPIGFQRWQRQPWHPILLEWEVAFHSAAEQSNLADPGKQYGSTFIRTNYDLKQDAVDFSPKPDKIAVVSGTNFYTGISILTPSAKIDLKKQIEAYLIRYVSQQEALTSGFFEARSVASADRDEAYLRDHVAELVAWYQQNFCQSQTDDPICNILRAYELLNDPKESILSQALSGFNDALLMHRQTMQLPVADPLGFADYQTFARQVSQAVQRSNRTAPLPLNDFNPIRAGAMEIRQLRLIDTFGRVKDLTWEHIITPETMRNPVNTNWPLLCPRLPQPARINFRWLSARRGVEEMNDHPATTPICGWLLPNHLDNSLMIYDNQGQALGLIDYLARWEPAPGSRRPISAEELHDPDYQAVNPHLKQVATYLSLAPNEIDPAQQAQKQSFLSAFRQTMDNALDNIDPENYAHHQSQALLIGRPIALVRASLNVELADPPAVDHSWPAFIQDLRRNTRDSHGFSEVQFPIRIGEHRQLNDGLVGFWIETAMGYADDLFYAPQSDEISHDRIRTHADETVNLYQSMAQDPYHLTMLIDPRGKVHVTTGILPTKDINIPPDQYVPALQAIEITFLTTPIVTPQGQINLDLPPEPGYTWSWLAKQKTNIDDPGRWVEISAQATIDKAVFLAHYPTAEAVWNHLHRPEVRWLQASTDDPTQAVILAQSDRRIKSLTGDFAGLETKINAILGVTADSTPTSPITQNSFVQQYPASENVWAELLTRPVGWLQPIAHVSDKAIVVPKDQRPKPKPANNGAVDTAPAQLLREYAGLETKVDMLFDLYAAGITPLHSKARFAGPQEIREGWLKLRHAESGANEAG
jgi:hypothetical protein